MKRDEFSEGIKRTLAERSAYFCNNPECKELTVGPHSDVSKSLKNGIAAHICAAAEGGPRYDSSMTQEERSSIENGIWLCHNCSDLIDKDEKKYTKELLLSWKKDHEIWIGSGKVIPLLPIIKFRTENGLSFPISSNIVTGEDIERYREQTLFIQNINKAPLYSLNIRIQFAEEFIINKTINCPVDTNISIKHERMRFQVSASKGASVTFPNHFRPTSNIVLELDKIMPNKV